MSLTKENQNHKKRLTSILLILTLVVTAVFGGTTAQRTNNNAYKNAETINNTVKIDFIRKYWFYSWNKMIEKAGARSVAQYYIDEMERKRKTYTKKTN